MTCNFAESLNNVFTFVDSNSGPLYFTGALTCGSDFLQLAAHKLASSNREAARVGNKHIKRKVRIVGIGSLLNPTLNEPPVVKRNSQLSPNVVFLDVALLTTTYLVDSGVAPLPIGEAQTNRCGFEWRSRYGQ